MPEHVLNVVAQLKGTSNSSKILLLFFNADIAVALTATSSNDGSLWSLVNGYFISLFPLAFLYTFRFIFLFLFLLPLPPPPQPSTSCPPRPPPPFCCCAITNYYSISFVETLVALSGVLAA